MIEIISPIRCRRLSRTCFAHLSDCAWSNMILPCCPFSEMTSGSKADLRMFPGPLPRPFIQGKSCLINSSDVQFEKFRGSGLGEFVIRAMPLLLLDQRAGDTVTVNVKPMKFRFFFSSLRKISDLKVIWSVIIHYLFLSACVDLCRKPESGWLFGSFLNPDSGFLHRFARSLRFSFSILRIFSNKSALLFY